MQFFHREHIGHVIFRLSNIRLEFLHIPAKPRPVKLELSRTARPGWYAAPAADTGKYSRRWTRQFACRADLRPVAFNVYLCTLVHTSLDMLVRERCFVFCLHLFQYWSCSYRVMFFFHLFRVFLSLKKWVRVWRCDINRSCRK